MQSPDPDNNSNENLKRSFEEATAVSNPEPILTDTDSIHQSKVQRRSSQPSPAPSRQSNTSELSPPPENFSEGIPATADFKNLYTVQAFDHLTKNPRPPTPPLCPRFNQCYFTDTLNFQPTGAYFDLLAAKEEKERVNPSVRYGVSTRPATSRLELLEEYLTEIKTIDLEQVQASEHIIKNCSRRSHIIGRIEDLITTQREELLAVQIGQIHTGLNNQSSLEEADQLPQVFDHQGQAIEVADQVLFRNEYFTDRVERGRVIQTFEDNICLVRVRSTGQIVAKFGKFLKLTEE